MNIFIKYKKVTIIAIGIVIFVFYWSQIRPSIIKRVCFNEVVPKDYSNPNHNLNKWISNKNYYDGIYSLCLKKHGI